MNQTKILSFLSVKSILISYMIVERIVALKASLYIHTYIHNVREMLLPNTRIKELVQRGGSVGSNVS